MIIPHEGLEFEPGGFSFTKSHAVCLLTSHIPDLPIDENGHESAGQTSSQSQPRDQCWTQPSVKKDPTAIIGCGATS
jgi:hypothetical protein